MQSGCVICHTISQRAEVPHIAPGLLGRQVLDLPGEMGRLRKRLQLHQGFPFRLLLAQGQVISVEQAVEQVGARAALGHLAALPAQQELGDIAAPEVPQVDLGAAVVLAGNLDGRAGDILQHTVLPEQLFPVAVHHDIGGGNVLEFHMAERQAALPGQDGGFPLAGKGAFHQDKGPAGRAFGGVDAVLSPQKDQVLHFISHIKDACLALANVEHTVGDKSMLGKVGPHHHGGGVPLFNLKVDVGDGAVKSAGVGVLNTPFHPGHVAREPEHVHGSPLSSWGAF